jgi:hypothetical protein
MWVGMAIQPWNEDNITETRCHKISGLSSLWKYSYFYPCAYFHWAIFAVTHGSAHSLLPHHHYPILSSHHVILHYLLHWAHLEYDLPSPCLFCSTELQLQSLLLGQSFCLMHRTGSSRKLILQCATLDQWGTGAKQFRIVFPPDILEGL